MSSYQSLFTALDKYEYYTGRISLFPQFLTSFSNYSIHKGCQAIIYFFSTDLLITKSFLSSNLKTSGKRGIFLENISFILDVYMHSLNTHIENCLKARPRWWLKTFKSLVRDQKLVV